MTDVRRTRTLALAALIALAAGAAYTAWSAVRPSEPAAAPAATHLPSCPPPASASGQLEVPPARSPETARREVALPGPAAAPKSTAARARVRVHGQVRRGGQPVPDYDLVFQPIGDGARAKDDDWDSTDEEGRYEVELRAQCRYVVLNDDEGPWVTEVVVPAVGRLAPNELLLDIDLPRRN